MPPLPHVFIDSPSKLPQPRLLEGQGQLQTSNNACTFTLLPGQSEASWLVPLSSGMRVDYTLSGAFRTRRSAPFPGRAQISVIIESLDGHRTKVPIFTAAAPDDSAYLSKSFSTREPAGRLVGLELWLRTLGDTGASLAIETLELRFAGNLPPTTDPVRAESFAPLTIHWNSHGIPHLQHRLQPIQSLHFHHISCSGPDSFWPHAEYLNQAKLDTQFPADDSPVILVLDLTVPPAWWPHEHYTDLDRQTRSYWTTALSYILRAYAESEFAARIAGVTAWLAPHENCTPSKQRVNAPEAAGAFRTWLEQYYASDAALAAAWQRDVSLTNARPKSAWTIGSWGGIVWQEKAQESYDNRRFFADSWAASLQWFAKQIKSLSAGNLAAGISGGPAYHQAAHLCESPLALTACASPAALSTADFAHIQRLPRSLPTNIAALLDGPPLSGQVAKKTLIQGMPLPGVLDFRLPAQLRRPLQSFSRKQTAQIAIVIDPELTFNLYADPRSADGAVVTDLLRSPEAMARYLGAPVDILSIDSLDPGPYRALVFLAISTLSPARIARIRASENGGRALIYLWSTGMLRPEGLSATGLASVARQPIAIADSPRSATLVHGHNQTYSWLNAHRQPHRLYPAPFVQDDSECEVLARYAESNEAALTVRHFMGFSSYFCALPHLPAPWLRRFSEQAGVHFYAPLEANATVLDNWLGWQPRSEQSLQLSLQRPELLFETFTRRALPAQRVHNLQAPADQSFLFRRSPLPPSEVQP